MENFHGNNSKVFTSRFLIILHFLHSPSGLILLSCTSVLLCGANLQFSIRGTDEDVNNDLFITGLHWLFCFMGTKQSF